MHWHVTLQHWIQTVCICLLQALKTERPNSWFYDEVSMHQHTSRTVKEKCTAYHIMFDKNLPKIHYPHTVHPSCRVSRFQRHHYVNRRTQDVTAVWQSRHVNIRNSNNNVFIKQQTVMKTNSLHLDKWILHMCSYKSQAIWCKHRNNSMEQTYNSGLALFICPWLIQALKLQKNDAQVIADGTWCSPWPKSASQKLFLLVG